MEAIGGTGEDTEGRDLGFDIVDDQSSNSESLLGCCDGAVGKEKDEKSCPSLVECSAGLGRTGVIVSVRGGFEEK
jgi:protein tyrosine phosphatase